jgi:pimeloyl-ACP methyl ester carboxylesterase
MTAETAFNAPTADGRNLRGSVWGPSEAPLLVYLHGTPVDARPDDDAIADAVRRGARIAAYARPGYPGSTRLPGRRIGDCVRDVLAVADHLGADRFAVYGHSGGAPHAIACAASGDPRVAAVAALAGPAPSGAEGLDWYAGQGADNVAEHQAAAAGEAALRPMLEEGRSGILATTKEDFTEGMATLFSPVDHAALAGGADAYFHAVMQAAVAENVDGWVDDDLAFLRDWGVSLDDVVAPLMIVHGDQDFMVPQAHGRWLASRLPAAESLLLTDEGHLTIALTRSSDVHAFLLGHLGD